MKGHEMGQGRRLVVNSVSETCLLGGLRYGDLTLRHSCDPLHMERSARRCFAWNTLLPHPGLEETWRSKGPLHSEFLQRGRIACNAERCNTYSNSVRLSVYMSHAGTLSRRMNVGSRSLHCEVAKTL